MKTLQQLCGVTTLLFVLSLSTRAGNIHTNVVGPPPPPASATTTEPGHITDPTSNGTESAIESESLLTELTLSLLQLLSVI
jgi:hypothetical protein